MKGDERKVRSLRLDAITFAYGERNPFTAVFFLLFVLNMLINR